MNEDRVLRYFLTVLEDTWGQFPHPASVYYDLSKAEVEEILGCVKALYAWESRQRRRVT